MTRVPLRESMIARLKVRNWWRGSWLRWLRTGWSRMPSLPAVISTALAALRGRGPIRRRRLARRRGLSRRRVRSTPLRARTRPGQAGDSRPVTIAGAGSKIQPLLAASPPADFVTRAESFVRQMISLLVEVAPTVGHEVGRFLRRSATQPDVSTASARPNGSTSLPALKRSKRLGSHLPAKQAVATVRPMAFTSATCVHWSCAQASMVAQPDPGNAF
jgi:hypothetical protein